jgi:hypothetical protein
VAELVEKAFDTGLNWLSSDPRSRKEIVADILNEIGEPE